MSTIYGIRTGEVYVGSTKNYHKTPKNSCSSKQIIERVLHH